MDNAAMSRRALYRLIALLICLHNAEEAIAFGQMWTRIRELALGHGLTVFATPEKMYLALAALSILALVGFGCVVPRLPLRARGWIAVVVQSLMFANALWHLFAALFICRGYAPGVVTAAALNIPFSIYLFRRAARERWLSRGSVQEGSWR